MRPRAGNLKRRYAAITGRRFAACLSAACAALCALCLLPAQAFAQTGQLPQALRFLDGFDAGRLGAFGRPATPVCAQCMPADHGTALGLGGRELRRAGRLSQTQKSRRVSSERGLALKPA